ncbi:TPA: IS4 family transposase, partial [Escherichia coli]|nr:IS4 family transposase [Escherichia coli]HAW3818235.1 IS4 family transposase [Escherichia coli]
WISPPEVPDPKRRTNSLWRITKMVIWSLQVAIRGTVSLTAYKTQLKNARHRLNEALRRRILQMVQPLS